MALGSGLRRLIRHVAPGGPAYRRALLSDVLSAAALGAVGDVICQVAVEEIDWKDLEKRRVIALTVFSSAYIGTPPSLQMLLRCTSVLTFAACNWELGRCILPSLVQSLPCVRICAGGGLEICTKANALPHAKRTAGRRDYGKWPWMRNSGQSTLWCDIHTRVLHWCRHAAGRFIGVRNCQPAHGVVDYLRRLHRLLASLHVVQLSVRAGGAARTGNGIGEPRVVSGDRLPCA